MPVLTLVWLSIIFNLACGHKPLQLEDALLSLRESRQNFENLLLLHLKPSSFSDQSEPQHSALSRRTVPPQIRKLQTTTSSAPAFRRGIRIRAPGAIYFDDQIVLQPNGTNLTISAIVTEFLGKLFDIELTTQIILFSQP